MHTCYTVVNQSQHSHKHSQRVQGTLDSRLREWVTANTLSGVNLHTETATQTLLVNRKLVNLQTTQR